MFIKVISVLISCRGLLELAVALGPDLGLEAEEFVARGGVAYMLAASRRDV